MLGVPDEIYRSLRKQPMKLDLDPLPLSGVVLIRSARVSDPRGTFAETYVKDEFVRSGILSDFVQDNQSFSVSAGTMRGLHFQIPPFQQAKLVRVLRGKIFDVVVDLRRSSATYGKHVGVELSADGGEQLFVPRGFAHGFCTLDDRFHETGSHGTGGLFVDSSFAVCGTRIGEHGKMAAGDRVGDD